MAYRPWDADSDNYWDGIEEEEEIIEEFERARKSIICKGQLRAMNGNNKVVTKSKYNRKTKKMEITGQMAHDMYDITNTTDDEYLAMINPYSYRDR